MDFLEKTKVASGYLPVATIMMGIFAREGSLNRFEEPNSPQKCRIVSLAFPDFHPPSRENSPQSAPLGVGPVLLLCSTLLLECILHSYWSVMLKNYVDYFKINWMMFGISISIAYCLKFFQILNWPCSCNFNWGKYTKNLLTSSASAFSIFYSTDH